MMKLLKRKLRSCLGASMILAMVFMLFCAFIGGTVLAAATANASRVANLAEQQEFMLERSAAMLLSDQLRLGANEDFRLHVVDANRKIEEVILLDGGGFKKRKDVEPTYEHVITFTLYTTDSYITPLQRLVIETSVLRYLQENATGEYSVVLQNIYSHQTSGGITDTLRVETIDGFWCQMTEQDVADKKVGGTLYITNRPEGNNDVVIPSYTANYSSGRGVDIYDFNVDFGENSQLKLHLDGFSGTSVPSTVLSPPTEYLGKTVQITTQAVQTTISWDSPSIEKGGAA